MSLLSVAMMRRTGFSTKRKYWHRQLKSQNEGFRNSLIKRSNNITRSESHSLSLLWSATLAPLSDPVWWQDAAAAFCPLRFNFRGKEQVLQFQNPKPFIATCWLLLGHVIIFEPITVAKLM